MCIRDSLFAPPLHLLNDTLLCLLNQQDASSIRIFQTTGKEMNQYTLKKKDTAIVISPDENLQARLEYLNPANNCLLYTSSPPESLAQI